MRNRGSLLSRLFYRKNFLIFTAILSTLVLVGSYFGIERGAKLFLNTTPPKWDIYLGSYAENSLNLRKKLITNERSLASVNKIFRHLTSHIHDSPYDFKVHIIKDKTANAFALPGGHIYVHTGLILLAKSPEELAGVLSHELGHVIKRHGSYQIFRYMMSSSIMSVALGGTSAGDVAATMGSTAYMLHYSREAEKEADQVGVELMIKAQLNPQGLINFFKHIEEEEYKVSGKKALKSMGYLQ